MLKRERVGKENPVDYGHLGYCEGLRDGFRSGELRCSPDELERIRVLAAAYRNGIEPGQTACEIRAREGAVSMNPDDVIGILTRSDKPEAAKVVQRLVRDLGELQDTANRLAGQVEDVLGAQAAKDAELRKVYDEAVVLADGEAVDACILLLDAVKKFLA